MPLTELDMNVLRAISTYYVLLREQIQSICSPDHNSGRGTRKRLSRLRESGYIVKHRVPVVLPGQNGAAPVYYATKKGVEALVSYFDDERFYATNTKTPRADRLCHWVALNNTRLLVEQAAAKLDGVEIVSFINEWETINKDDARGEQFCLHTQLNDNPPLSCSPDAGFLLRYRDKYMVYYVEQDRATSSPKQIAARKYRGYAELQRQRGHLKHFPAATVPFFRVLFVTLGDVRAEKTCDQMKDRDGRDLWLMINQRKLTEDNFFTGSLALDSAGAWGPILNVDAQKPPSDTDSAPT